MVVSRLLRPVSGYLLVETILTLSILGLLLVSAFTITTSYLSSLQNNLTCFLLFSELQYGQMMAVTQNTDVTFNLNNAAFSMSLPYHSVYFYPFSNQQLQITNASGIGFTESGHTKYSATIKINGLTSPAVSLGVGYGKVTLK